MKDYKMANFMEANIAPQYLRVKDVATMTGMGVSTLWALSKTGDFPKPIKLSPRVTVWKSSSIAEWLEKKEGQQNV